MEKLKLQDFKIELEKDQFDEVHEKILEKTIELAKNIANYLNIKLNIDNKEDDVYYQIYIIRKTFEEEIARFRDMSLFLYSLDRWEYEEWTSYNTPKDVIKVCIRRYNEILDEFEYYLNIEKTIDKEGFETLLRDREQKLVKIFKEMLDYKNKKYKEDSDFVSLADKVYQYYNIYSFEIENAIRAFEGRSAFFDVEKDLVPMTNVDRIMYLDDLYNELTYKEGAYKEHANDYRDFELEEGQTFGDLYNFEKEKFKKLFKNMLEFVHFDIEQSKYTKDFEGLRIEVASHYPYYKDMLYSMISYDLNTTYIQQLDRMEDVYEHIVENYKNHEENMKEYEIYKKKTENDEDKFDELDINDEDDPFIEIID